MQEKELIPQLFKTEYRKIISVLCKLFGIVHIEIEQKSSPKKSQQNLKMLNPFPTK